MIDKDAVAAVCHIKRDVFVGLLRASAAVLVPDINALSVFRKCREALAESVDQLSHGKSELLAHVSVIASLVICHTLPVCFHIRKITVCAPGKQLAVSFVGHRERQLRDNQRQASAGNEDLAFRLLHLKRYVFAAIQLKLRSLFTHTQIVARFHAQNLRRRRRNLDCQINSSQSVAALLNPHGRAHKRYHFLIFLYKINLLRGEAFAAFLLQPASVSEFHIVIPPSVSFS